MAPSAGASDRPAGSDPALIDQVKAPVPPVALSEVEYGLPTAASVTALVVTSTAPTTFTVADPDSTAELAVTGSRRAAARSTGASEPGAAPEAVVVEGAAGALVTLVAVMVADPALSPVTTPSWETLAIFGADEVQITVGSPPLALLLKDPVTVASSVALVLIVGVGSITASAAGEAWTGGLAAEDAADLAELVADFAAWWAAAAAVAAEWTTGRRTTNHSASSRPAARTAMPNSGSSQPGSICFSSITPSALIGAPSAGRALISNGRVRFGPLKKVRRGTVVRCTKVAVPGTAVNSVGLARYDNFRSGSDASMLISSRRLPRFSTISRNRAERRPVEVLGTRLTPTSLNSPTWTTPSSIREPSGSSCDITRNPNGTSPGARLAILGGRNAIRTCELAPGSRLT